MDPLKDYRNSTAVLSRISKGEVFFNAIILMAYALGMPVVTEGVETRNELHVLQRHGCDAPQGYLICRSVASDYIPALL